MSGQAIDIPALAEDIVNLAGWFDRRDERVALALYRLLAEGEPVSDQRLAARAGRPVSEVADWLRGARVELDERGEMVAFQGLSLRPTKHLFEVNGRTLYAWCAGDTLWIQDLLDLPARVRTDPITGRTVSLSLEDGRVRDVEPSTAMLSMLRPDTALSMLRPEDVIPASCGPRVHRASQGDVPAHDRAGTRAHPPHEPGAVRLGARGTTVADSPKGARSR